MSKQNKNINEIIVKKPNAFLYGIIALGVKLIAKVLFRLKIDNKEVKKLKAPFVVIGNHASVLDIVFTVSGMLPKRLNIVTAKDVFTWRIFKPFIERVGCIPKSQFAIDITSLKTMKAAIEQGRIVTLFPEGKVSFDGRQLHHIPPSIAKFVKFLDAPVVLSYNLGSYLSMPKYYKGFRYGKVHLKQKVIITQEELRTLPNAEIYKRIVESLQFNDNIYQQENNIRFRSRKPALGMEFILYKCPKCSREYQMMTTKRHIICQHCNNTVEYTEYGQLNPVDDSVSFGRVDLWYDYQREAVDEEIRQEDFYISKPVDFYMDIDRKYKLLGEGELYINKEEIGYKGTKNGEHYEISIPLRTLHTLTTKTREGIDLSYEDCSHRFMFKEKKYSTKYNLIVEQMYRLIHNLDRDK